MKRKAKQLAITEENVLAILHLCKPTPSKKIGDKLNLPQTRKVGFITKERSELQRLIRDMIDCGVIENIPQQGLIRLR